MQGNFSKALQLTLVHEGGFVNNPHDPGGATMQGVTQVVYNNYRNKIGEMTQSVQNITYAELEDIYKTEYWDKVCGDSLPTGVDYCVFDAAVNSGYVRAIKWLQEAVGASVDGLLGPVTLTTVNSADAATVIASICAERLSFCQSLPIWGVFGKGWAKRFSGVEGEAKSMVP